MSKKLISVMLALVMVLSVFSVSAFAASINVEYETFDEEAGETEVAYTQTWYLDTTNEPDADGKFTVDVYLETNYSVGTISFNVTADGATLEGVAFNDVLLDSDGYNAYEDESNLANGNIYIIPHPKYEAADGLDLSTATAIATLTYSLNEGVSTATVTLNNDAKTIDNDGKLIAVRLGDDILASDTMYYGQRVLNADGEDVALGDVISEVTLGEEVATTAPTLVAKEGTKGVVDTSRTVVDEENRITCDGYLYGVSSDGETIEDVFEVVGDGYMAIVPNDAGSNCGTGTIVKLYDRSDRLVAMYALVIFGDVNGDGAITAADYGDVKIASLGGAIAGEINTFAADVNGDGSITAADYGDVKIASLGGDLTVNPYAVA